MKAQNKKTFFRRQVRGFAAKMIATEYVIIVVTLYASMHTSIWWWPFYLTIIGYSQWALSDNIGHWATHLTLFRKESLNKSLEWIYFYPVFTTWKEWKEPHMDHHRFVGEVNDPQTETFKRWGLSEGKKFWQCFLFSPYSDFKKSFKFLWIFRNGRLAFFWLGIIGIVSFFYLWSIFILWMLAYFTTRVYVMFFSEASEHWNAQIPKTSRKKDWGTRNLTGIFYRLYKRWADFLHKLHHSFPDVPPSKLIAFYKAKKLENLADEEYLLKLDNLTDVFKDWQSAT